MGHLMNLSIKHTAIGESNLTGCVYSLLTSAWVKLSFLCEHMLSLSVYYGLFPEEIPGPNSPFAYSLSLLHVLFELLMQARQGVHARQCSIMAKKNL